MNDEILSPAPSLVASEPIRYIETPRAVTRPERIDTLLTKRMREFMLARRQKAWRKAADV